MQRELVDAHCHLWDWRHQRQTWLNAPLPLARSFTVDDLTRSCIAADVASVVLIESGTTQSEAALLERNAAASPLIRAFIAFADPFQGGSGRLLDRLAEHPKFRGVRLRLEGRPSAEVDDPKVIRLAQEVTERGLSLDLLVTTEHLDGVLRLAGRVPNLRGIIDHMAKPDLHKGTDAVRWRRLVSEIAQDTELVFKVSLSPRASDFAWFADHPRSAWPRERVRPYIHTLLEIVGSNRLAWGSDWPIGVFGSGHTTAVATMAAALGEVDPATEDALFRSTATAFYGLNQ